jgi:hypothetical protein
LAKPPRQAGADLDWYLIQVSTLKKIGLILLVGLVVAGLAYVAYNHLTSDRSRAQSRLKEAVNLVEQIPKLPDFASLKPVYIQLQELLQEAQKAFMAKDYAAALSSATQAAQRAQDALSGAQTSKGKGVEEILDLEGKVQVQRKEQGTWEDAKPRMPLYAGDFVKTGSGGSARLITESNVIIVLPPDSLHEVAQPATTSSGERQHKVKLIYGQADIITQSQKAQIVTMAATGEVDLNSQTYVSVRENRAEFRTDRGSTTVSTQDGKTIALNPLQKVNIAGGKAGEVVQVLPKPRLMEPVNNKTVVFTPNLAVKLQWEKVPGAVQYIVQVSYSSFFVEFQEKRKAENYLSVRIPAPADYYWRVAALDAKGNQSPWSTPEPCKFRVIPPGEAANLDKTPPPLEVAPENPLGNSCIVRGVTEPGASVTIDGEQAFTKEDGTFYANITLRQVGVNQVVVKAVDPFGNETVKKVLITVQDY